MARLRIGSAPLLVADQAVVSGCNLLTTVLLVRGLGLEAFGAYSLVWIGVVFAVGLAQALVAQPMMAIGPKERGAGSEEYWAAALRLQGALTVALAALAAAAVELAARLGGLAIDPAARAAVVAAVAARPLHATVRAAFFARGQRRAALANDLVAYPGQVLLLLALGALDRLTVASALGAIAVAGGLAAALGLARLGAWRTSRAALAGAARRHLAVGRWLAATHATSFFASNSYVVAAGALLGPAAVGAIKAGHAVVGVLHLVLLTMENAVPPSAARILAERGPAALRAYLARVGARGLAAIAALALVLGAAARPALELAYGGAASDEAVLAVRALSFLYVFAFAIALLQTAFRTIEETRPVFVAYAVNALVALTCASPVVAAHGFAGAVWGMLAQQALMTALLAAAAVRRARPVIAPRAAR